MIDPDSDDESEKETEHEPETQNNREEYSRHQDVEIASNASGSAIIKNHSRLSVEKGK